MRTTWPALRAFGSERPLIYKRPLIQSGRTKHMARITSSAENTVIMTSFPPSKIPSHISALESVVSKTQDDGTGGNPMLVLEFTVDEGPFKDRKVGFYNVMIGGKTKKGMPMPIRQLLEVIDSCKLPWCTTPGGQLVARPFKRVKADDGSIMFVDPDTNSRITTIEYDTDHFINARCKVNYGVKKQEGSDRDFNEVRNVEPL